ncbi:MAG: CoA transferase, partial [Chloroflexi bacterium]|nr:CoA transferase [Chloroflexota bacterium]
KRSIMLNLKHDAAREIFYRLAQDADVIMEAFRPGVVARLGIDYPTIRARNPRIIYCSISGYGQGGPYAHIPGHDLNYISVAGALGGIGHPGGPPVIPFNLMADRLGGYAVGLAILAAVLARQQTGAGQYLDLAMTDIVTGALNQQLSWYFGDGTIPERGKMRLNGGAPHYNVYETADGQYVSVACLERHFYDNLCRALGRADLIPFYDAEEHWPAVFAAFRAAFHTRTRDEWFAALQDQDVCIARVYRLDEIVGDPQVQYREMILTIDDPEVGRLDQVGMPLKFSETPGSVRTLGPVPGRDTPMILESLGYDAATIAALRAEGVVA